MESQQTKNANDDFAVGAIMQGDSNIIINDDFSMGLHSWHPNSCHGFVVSPELNYPEGTSEKSLGNYAVVTQRKECWQGLEQDITNRVSPGFTYLVSACVGVSGPLQESADVLATLKLEYRDSETTYMFIGKTSVSKENWKSLEGTFSLSTLPDRVVFYFEGPSTGWTYS